MEYRRLEFSEEEGRLLATVRPSDETTPLDVDGLRALIAGAGYGDWFVLEEALPSLVERCNAQAGESQLTIAERRDGSFSLEVSPDAMHVWLDIVPARGGKAPEPDEIFEALGAAGVVFNVDQAAVHAACASTEPQRVPVAAGEAAKAGEDTRFELIVCDTRIREPQIGKNGLIDFHELGAIPMVAADDPLMRRIPPTPGVAGRNVRGEVIEAIPGRNEAFAENLVGAYVARDDANLLRAVFKGQPVRCGNGVMVEQVLHIRNVDIDSGNVNFDGTVHVEGEVLPGMKVQASGDIIVSGVVDGCELKADGDIRIGGGIIAHASVHAGGAVSARFVENSKVYAGTTIAIDDSALQSELQAMNQIVVGIKSTQRGRLAGGSAHAMLLIQAPILGGASGGVTHIQIGVNPVLEAAHHEIMRRIEAQKENETKLEQLLKHLTTHGDKHGMLERAKASWEQAVQVWAKLLGEREEMEDRLALIAGASLEVKVAVAGAVDIHFGKKFLHLRRSLDAGTFTVDGERIVFADTSGVISTAF